MDELGWKFWLLLFAGIVAAGIAAILLFSLIGFVWYAWGALAVFLLIMGVFLVVGYFVDRSHGRPV